MQRLSSTFVPGVSFMPARGPITSLLMEIVRKRRPRIRARR
jgi:hypothetical protein